MKITIKTLKNKKFQLDVEDNETIGQIKQRIEHELKLGEASSQKLIHSGHILKDDQTVASAKILENDFLVVMVSGAKPGKKDDEPAPAAPVQAPAPVAQPAPAAAPAAPAAAAAAAPAVPAQAAPAQAPAANAAPANAAQAAASNLVMGPAYEEMVNNLMALGFPRDQVVAALRASFNNPDRAAQYLFGGIPDELLAAQAQQPQAGAPAAAAAARGGAPAQAHAHAHPAQGDEAGDMEHEHEHDNEEDAEMDEEALAGLQNAPELQQLRQLMQQNPQIIPMLLQQLQQSNPQLMQAFGNNPEALLALLGAAGGGGGGGGGGGAPPQGGPGRPHVIQITPEEKRSIDNLEALGFSRRRALEAFLICDRNEELAANYLFDQGNDPEELPQAPPGRQGQGGGGNPPAGGH